MAKLTTRQALAALLTGERYLLTWLRSGYTKAERSRYLYRLKKGELSDGKVTEILERCGVGLEIKCTLPKPTR